MLEDYKIQSFFQLMVKWLLGYHLHDFVGKSVYHCHLMFHGDFGMMGTFEVVK